MTNGRYKERDEQKEEGIGGGLDIQIPDASDILATLDTQLDKREEVFKAHVDQMEKDEEDVKKGKKKAKQKPKGGTICFCGNPNCNIGGFVEIQGGE